MEELFTKRRILRTKKDEYTHEKLKEVEMRLSELCAEDNYRIIEEACAGLTCEEGGLNSGKLWKLKRRLKGIAMEPPTAMLDHQGSLVTSSKEIEKLTISMYQERLKALKIRKDLILH